MGDVKIKDIFQKDITRKINGVVKAEQNTGRCNSYRDLVNM